MWVQKPEIKKGNKHRRKWGSKKTVYWITVIIYSNVGIKSSEQLKENASTLDWGIEEVDYEFFKKLKG